MVGAMQINGSSLLIAAQAALKAQPARTLVQPANAAEKTDFQPLEFAKAEPAPRSAQTIPGPVQRPGSQLDIKI